MNPLAWIDDELRQLDLDGLRRELATRVGPQAARVEVCHRSHANFSSNDYLALAADERLAEAARGAAADAGWGSGASPLISGRSAWHAKLEARLAQFEGTEATLLFPSGFVANAGIIPALAGEGDAIFADVKNHASIIDGCRLSRAHLFLYPHADIAALARRLRRAAGYRRRLIVTDSLFSMDGDFAPLVELADIASEFGAMLMIDEAHATGVFGTRGRGVVEHLSEQTGHRDLHDRMHVRVGTLSKALGTNGGFVAGSQSLINWLANRARSYIYSTAAPAATCAAGLAALEIVESEPERRRALLSRAADLRTRLADQGWDIGASASQIIPIRTGTPAQAVALASRLREAGYFVPAIRPPSVSADESMLRLSLCHHHTAEMIDRLVRTFARLV